MVIATEFTTNAEGAVEQALGTEKTDISGWDVITLGLDVKDRTIVRTESPGDGADAFNLETIGHTTDTKITGRRNGRRVEVGRLMGNGKAGASIEDNGVAVGSQADETVFICDEVLENRMTGEDAETGRRVVRDSGGLVEVIEGFKTTINCVGLMIEIADTKKIRAAKLFVFKGIKEVRLIGGAGVDGVHIEVLVAVGIAKGSCVLVGKISQEVLELEAIILSEDPRGEVDAIVE